MSVLPWPYPETGGPKKGGGSAGATPYAYGLDPAEDASVIVSGGAGPGNTQRAAESFR